MAILEPPRSLSPLEIPQEEDTGLELSNFPSQIGLPSIILAHHHQYETSEPSPVLHQNQYPSLDADQPPLTPRYAFASTGLPPAYRTSALHPFLGPSGSGALYRPFPVALPEHQGIPAVIVPGDTPAHLFLVRLSHAPGDYKMLAFPTGAFFTSVNDVLLAVRTALAGAGAEPKPEELGEAKEGSVRLNSMGGWMWTGFVLGSDGVWELSLV